MLSESRPLFVTAAATPQVVPMITFTEQTESTLHQSSDPCTLQGRAKYRVGLLESILSCRKSALQMLRFRGINRWSWQMLEHCFGHQSLNTLASSKSPSMRNEAGH